MATVAKKVKGAASQADWPHVHFRLPPELHEQWKRRLAATDLKVAQYFRRLIRADLREQR
jgi:hypothetical protein